MPLLEFQHCWDRIDRAEAHSNALAKAWSEFLQDEPYVPILYVDDDGTGSLSLVPRYDALPTVLSLELGEILYQLRATLDGAVYGAAVRETGKDPPPDYHRLEFPVCSLPAHFQDCSYKIAPLTGKRRRIIEAIQPYNAPPDLRSDYMVFSLNRTLGILHDWAKKDRHRKLHIVGSWASNVSPLLCVPKPASVAAVVITGEGFLEQECELATFTLSGFVPGMTVQANPNLSIDIAVDEVPPPVADNDTLGMRIKAMFVLARTVVRAFERSLAQEDRKRRIGLVPSRTPRHDSPPGRGFRVRPCQGGPGYRPGPGVSSILLLFQGSQVAPRSRIAS